MSQPWFHPLPSRVLPFPATSPSAQVCLSHLSRTLRPQPRCPFGSDPANLCILSRVMKGAANSLIVGWVAVGIGMGFGVLLGSLAAFWRGWKDEGVMGLVEVLYGFP